MAYLGLITTSEREYGFPVGLPESYPNKKKGEYGLPEYVHNNLRGSWLWK